jgi:hypothetical protein
MNDNLSMAYTSMTMTYLQTSAVLLQNVTALHDIAYSMSSEL